MNENKSKFFIEKFIDLVLFLVFFYIIRIRGYYFSSFEFIAIVLVAVIIRLILYFLKDHGYWYMYRYKVGNLEMIKNVTISIIFILTFLFIGNRLMDILILLYILLFNLYYTKKLYSINFKNINCQKDFIK